jgi:hypothetical protein
MKTIMTPPTAQTVPARAPRGEKAEDLRVGFRRGAAVQRNRPRRRANCRIGRPRRRRCARPVKRGPMDFPCVEPPRKTL